jgi:hypothetical protein
MGPIPWSNLKNERSLQSNNPASKTSTIPDGSARVAWNRFFVVSSRRLWHSTAFFMRKGFLALDKPITPYWGRILLSWATLHLPANFWKKCTINQSIRPSNNQLRNEPLDQSTNGVVDWTQFYIHHVSYWDIGCSLTPRASQILTVIKIICWWGRTGRITGTITRNWLVLRIGFMRGILLIGFRLCRILAVSVIRHV